MVFFDFVNRPFLAIYSGVQIKKKKSFLYRDLLLVIHYYIKTCDY